MASSITINSNLAAINAQRRLDQSTQNIQQSFIRLSSGLRINKASDDAAGLAISESLNVDAHVYAQGIRNLSDGISLTNIAEGAMQELTNITIRQRELATQAATGTYSLEQRTALAQECNALADEYRRITESTSFNDQPLFTTDCELCVQGGYGSGGAIVFSLPSAIDAQQTTSGIEGTGSFSDRTSFSTGASPACVTLGDLNGDGVLDMVTADGGSNKVSVYLGNGDGTFHARTSLSTGISPCFVTLGDMNGDGAIDMVTVDTVMADRVSVFLGNGDGSFRPRTSIPAGFVPMSVTVGDLNGDSALDMVVASSGTDAAGVFLGNGDGSFGSMRSIPTGYQPCYVSLGDLNGDEVLDLVTADDGDTKASVLLGNGDGTFHARNSFTTGSGPASIAIEDVNGDNVLDMIIAESDVNTASVFLGNGNGTFHSRNSFSTGSAPSFVTLGDLNGDGVLDMVTADRAANSASVLLGNGDGSFCARRSFSTGSGPQCATLGDLNGDGALDIVTTDKSAATASVFIADTQEQTTGANIDLSTAFGAFNAMAVIDVTLQRISRELGLIGAVQSRLGVAIATLCVARESYLSARSQITDADVPAESAQLVKNRILQQAGAAVLAQANQAPALALTLLKGG